MEWQPIETAPKDGSPFLGYCLHGQGQFWLLQAEGDSFYSDDGLEKVFVPCATHWMPLPEPPNLATPTHAR